MFELCGYCGTEDWDHKHKDGTVCCSSCCATHGGLCGGSNSDKAAYDLMETMHERIRIYALESAETSRILGISAERELSLITKISQLERQITLMQSLPIVTLNKD